MKKVVFTVFLVSFFIGTTVMTSVAAGEQERHHANSSTQGMMGSQGMMGMDQRPCVNNSNSGSMPYGMGAGMGSVGNHMMGARNMGHMMGPGMGSMRNHMMGAGNMRHMFFLDRANELGLDADQVSKLKSIHVASRTENIRNDAEAKIARLELADMLSSDNWTLSDAESLVRKLQKLEGDIQVRRLQAMSDARKILTADQLKQARSGENMDNLEDLFE